MFSLEEQLQASVDLLKKRAGRLEEPAPMREGERMDNAIVKQETSLTPGDWNAMREAAKALVASKFLPKAVDTPEKAIAIMMTGRELGIGPMQALRCVNIIDGKPTLAAELIAALVLKRVPGALFRIAESTNERCVIEAARPGQESTEFIFSIDDAKAAGLTGKDNWKKYPRAMLRCRCITEAARAVFPDATMGTYDPDELGAVTTPDGDIVSTPERLPRITTHAEPDEEPDATGDPELQALYMAQMEAVEGMIEAAESAEECEGCRKIMGSRTRKTELTEKFRADRFARRLGPGDEREFAKAWQRCNRKLDKKEAEFDPGSAAEVIDKMTGEVIR
jgi:hypothetical protein